MSRVSRTIKYAFGSTMLAGFAVGGLAGCSRHGSSAGQKPLSIAGCVPGPFVDHRGSVPPKSEYNGPLFQLSHAYPSDILPPMKDPPWQAKIGGRITPANAGDYVEELKRYVAPAMRKMLLDPEHWNAGQEGWYNEPWLGCWVKPSPGGREPIHGMYLGTDNFPISQFPGTGLRAPFSTYVLTYYDRRAANTLYKVWGADAKNPKINVDSGQFAPGSVIVKAAFTTANADMWPPMQNALQWPAYITTNATAAHSAPRVDKLSFMQFDIIVKDPIAAPSTGWVFATLVYDQSIRSGDAWDRMVPLGAMWGNDPKVNSSLPNHGSLTETWINPKAPAYATKTLGWGGRLSGPNDGALNDAVTPPVGLKQPNLASSSCMGCHISAEWPQKSFLLPTRSYPPESIGPDGDYLVMWTPGSPGWMRWFQSPPGNRPMDPDATAMDYDMVFVFKSLPAWAEAMQPNTPMIRLNRKGQVLESYNGKPLSK